ncbi:MAG: FapA family protein [Nannocystaceae bacterium]|nr:FapA family protein [Nannocystaceae bacterium]
MSAARLIIDVSPDEMRAWLRVQPGPACDGVALREALDHAGVCFGVDDEVFAGAASNLADPSFACEALAIASGRTMLRGVGSVCVLAVPLGLQAGHALADGSFDYRDRGLLTAVHRGQRVASCTPAQPGRDGCTVTGRAIPSEAPVDADAPQFGEGFEQDRRGNVLALRDGVIRRQRGGRLTIGDHVVHEHDVDLHSGHLDMLGSLTILGSVTSKFEAQASEDVEIGKGVLGGSVYAGGSVRVRGGIVGTGGGVVLAEHDVEAEHAQAATIGCGGTLHLRRGALHSALVAQRIVIEGAVRGGHVHAERELVVGDAGARMGGEVELAVGVAVARPLRRRFEAERHERHAVERLGGEVSHTRARERARGHGEPEPPPELLHAAHIDVRGTIHAGCVVVVCGHRTLIDAPHRRVRISFDAEHLGLRFEPLP